MDKYSKRIMECCERVITVGKSPDITFTPAETALFTAVETNWTTMQALVVDQIGGKLEFNDAVKDRRLIGAAALILLAAVRDVARSLALAGTPGVTYEAYRLPRTRSYASIAATAEAFAEAAEPHKAKFIERGLAATFIEDLEALPAQLTTASGDRVEGRLEHTGGTAGIKALAAAGLKLVQQLRPVMRLKFASDPAKLGAWNLAARVEADRDSKPATPPAGSGDGSGTTPPPSGS
jgi:hypothetical protein